MKNNYLEEINKQFPVRKTQEEKQAFRSYVLDCAQKKEAYVQTQTTSDGKNDNIVIGDVERAKVVLTAHYDTPAKSVFPNLMLPRNKPLFFLYQFGLIGVLLLVSLAASYAIGMVWAADRLVFLLAFLVLYYGLYFGLFRLGKNPYNYNDNTSGVATLLSILDTLDEEQMKKTAFIFFDNEEKGKKGSKAYFADHKEQMQERLLVNFDCVGNGDTMVFIAKPQAEQMPAYALLKESFSGAQAYKTQFYPYKGSESNSDYKSFPCGVGCMACKRSKKGVLYTPYIHTVKDVQASVENIAFLTKKTVGFISAL